MSPRPDVSAERKPQILQAALQVFLRKGFTNARMEDIARYAEMSVGNLYRYFPGKLEIVLVLMELFLEPGVQVLNDLVSAPGTCRERLEQSILTEIQEQDTTTLTLYNEMNHLARIEPRVRDLLASYNTRYQQSVAAIIEQGIQRGELRPTTNPVNAAFAFEVIFDGIMQNIMLMPKTLDLPAVLCQTFDMIFDGLEITDSNLS